METQEQTQEDVVAEMDAMFGTQTEGLEKKVEAMAVFIAVEGDAIDATQDTINARKANLDQVKAELATLMRQNGIEKLSLTNGLTPKAVIKRKYFKATGVSDELLQQWLFDNGLGDIIKPTVNFNTMQSTLASFNGEIPDAVFNVTDVPSITMYGKAKFLAERSVA
jgi:hypothetical protein